MTLRLPRLRAAVSCAARSLRRSGRMASCWLAPAFAVLLYAPLPAAAGAFAHTPYVFDDADRLAQSSAFPPWAEMMQRRTGEPFSLEACIALESACSPSMRGARVVVLRGRGLPPTQQIDLVNRFVNDRRYAGGAVQRVWETPASFLRSGGDCEDYAVTKYFMLRALGFAVADLRVVVARDRRHAAQHALLAVRQGAAVRLLDIDGSVRAGAARSDYLYLYSVNEEGLWDHAGRRARATRS